MRHFPALVAVLLSLSALIFSAGHAHAAVDVFEFDTPQQEQRFHRLSTEFRCPMCQNTNLADSPGGVAADLRREVYRMIMDGYSDQEIEQFMHQRYGDFIFYRPRLNTQTILLWFGPLIFLLIGGWVIFGIIRRSRPKQDKTVLSEAEQQRLDQLLAKRKADADHS